MPVTGAPSSDLQEPLLLLGNFNDWSPDVAKKFHCFRQVSANVSVVESVVCVQFSSAELSFQVVSARHCWQWRIWPADGGVHAQRLVDGQCFWFARLAAGANSEQAHGKNFRLAGHRGLAIELKVSLNDKQIRVSCRSVAPPPTPVAPPPGSAPLPVPQGVPGQLGPVGAPGGPGLVAAETPRPAQRPAPAGPGPRRRVRVRPKRPLNGIGELEPLRLVGQFCDWVLEVPGLTTDPVDSAGDEEWREHRICFQLQGPKVEFQVVSDPLGFRWRLYPDEDMQGGQLGQGISCTDAMMGGDGDGHGMNFCIAESPSTFVLLAIRLKVPPRESDPPEAVELRYTTLEDGPQARKLAKVALGSGKVVQLQNGSNGQGEAWTSDPHSFSLEQVEPLRLVGKPCNWRLEQRGLKLEQKGANDGWRRHSLCFRMLTRQVDFQIVSDRLCFRYRLIPEAVSELPCTDSREKGVLGAVVGKDEGHGKNFTVRGAPLSVVTVSVWLEEASKGQTLVTGRARLAYIVQDSGVAVNIGAASVQFPPKQLTPLTGELLEMAETEDEKAKVMEMRYELVRKATWQLQLEYGAEDVQQEVLALRVLYPYRQSKGVLAIEMDKKQQAPAMLENAKPAKTESGEHSGEPKVKQKELDGGRESPTLSAVSTDADGRGGAAAGEEENPAAPEGGEGAEEQDLTELSDSEKLWRVLVDLEELLSTPEAKNKLMVLRRDCINSLQFERARAGAVPKMHGVFSCYGVTFDWFCQASAYSEYTGDDCWELSRKVWDLLSFGAVGPLHLEKGQTVMISGLEGAREHLNGSLVAVADYMEQHGRYAVTLLHGGEQRVKPEHLSRVDDEKRARALQEALLQQVTSPEVLRLLDGLRGMCASKAHFERLRQDKVLAPYLSPIMNHFGVDHQWYAKAVEEVGRDDASVVQRAADIDLILSFAGQHAQAASKEPQKETSPLVGTWSYGTRGLQYRVFRSEVGHLFFNGPYSGGRVTGVLRLCDGQHQADLASKSGDIVGAIRLRHVQSNDTMISNFRGTNKPEWNKDIVGTRVSSSGDCEEDEEAAEEGGGESAPIAEDEKKKQECIAGLDVIEMQLAKHTRAGAAGAGEEEAGAAGARAAHVEHMKLQQKALARRLRDGSGGTSAQEAAAERLFGNTESQYMAAVQHLPSVKAARFRAMDKIGVPRELALNVIRFGEQRHEVDRCVREANALTLKRLRFYACPHPNTMQAVVQALGNKGFWTGGPPEWFFGLDTSVHADWAQSRHDVEKCWSAGRFKQWFGGPKAGRYMVTSAEELYEWGCMSLFESVINVRDQLEILIRTMGEEGAKLQVEPRALLAYHAEGEILPPWEDAAGKRSRRLTLTFHLSTSHFKVSDGGALRLHRKGSQQSQGQERSGLVADVPAGGGNWCIFRTHEFKQEVTRVKLPCGRWCITVCAEDMEVAEKLRRNATMGPSYALALTGSGDNFEAQVVCARCQFAAGDGVTLRCPEEHHLCRECMHMEIRKEMVPSCPACCVEDDRVAATMRWELFDEGHGLEDLGCVCCEDAVDPGSRVIIFGQTKESKLNGKLGQAIWWDEDFQCWDIFVFATGHFIKVSSQNVALADPCQAGSCLGKCPCWPSGRGIWPISLGNRCCSKLGIDECTGSSIHPDGYPKWHGTEYLPFDSIVTTLQAVIFFLRHSFAHFFHFNDCLDVHPKQCPNVVFHNYRSTIHSFPHHHPNLDGDKLYRRIERFKLLCHHSRDTRGARTPLFVRFMGCEEEFSMIEELYSLLRLWAGPRLRLFFVCMFQRKEPLLLRHAKYPRILFYLVGRVTVMDFKPIKQACKFAVYDEAGLLDCKTTTTRELKAMAVPFTDPYTTKSPDCDETWLRPLDGRDPVFFPDCPRAQKPHQSCSPNESLRAAVRRGGVEEVRDILQNRQGPYGRPTFKTVADANTWDNGGRTPMHDLCDLAVAGRIKIDKAVMIAGDLLLAHGDPRCRDRGGVSVLDALEEANKRAKDASVVAPLRALLAAAILEDRVDTAALYQALETLGEPRRSQMARILAISGLRPLGEAELTWRNPPPDSESIIAELDEQLRAFEKLPERERKKEMKKLLLEWHPDKNADRLSLATTVFQYLQTKKGDLINR